MVPLTTIKHKASWSMLHYGDIFKHKGHMGLNGHAGLTVPITLNTAYREVGVVLFLDRKASKGYVQWAPGLVVGQVARPWGL